MINLTNKRREKEIQKLNAKREKLSTAIKTTTDLKKKEYLKTRRYNLTAQIGNLYLDQREFDKARTLYESLPWKSHGEDRYFGITRELIEEGKYEEAKSLLDEGLSKYPESWELLNSMGLVFQRTDDHYVALKYFERALAIVDNNNTAVLYNKALALNCLGYHEEAFKVLTDLLEKAPDDPGYLVELGYCNLQRKEPWAAIYYYRTAKEMGFETDSVYGGLCCAYIETGLHHEAYMIAREGVEKIPDAVGLYENLAEAARDLGSLEEANEVIQKGLALDPEYEPLKILQQDLTPRLGLKVKRHLPTKHLSDKEFKKAERDYMEMLGEPPAEELKKLEEFLNKNKKGKRR
jgi:tetratricopeptide (TPR) repeat protein